MANLKIKIDDINISSFTQLISPDQIRKDIPIRDACVDTVIFSRQIIANILRGQDKRKLIVVGPCSIHDPKSALEYAGKLKNLAEEVSKTLFLVMRVYFEKPRTTVGWKGFINDPYLDNSYKMNEGLHLARQLLIDITQTGLPVASEALEPISPQYIAEFISWTAIGARTTESQTHRELASGLSSPVGFKNNTDGNIEVAINAIKSAERPHHFLGMDHLGRVAIVATKGNPYGHLILRGGRERPNYDRVSVQLAQKALVDAGLAPNIVIDCSHDNSLKDYRNQPQVFEDCIQQILRGNESIVGLMLESHINSGNQRVSDNLKYGVSITDACLDFDSSAELIRRAHRELSDSRLRN